MGSSDRESDTGSESSTRKDKALIDLATIDPNEPKASTNLQSTSTLSPHRKSAAMDDNKNSNSDELQDCWFTLAVNNNQIITMNEFCKGNL